MSKGAEELLELLTSRNNSQAYQALKALEEMSAEGNCLYPHMDKFIAMASSGNSYVRMRGLALIARNAKWDVDGKIDGIIDRYLEHVTDEKPICARQCIKLLPPARRGQTCPCAQNRLRAERCRRRPLRRQHAAPGSKRHPRQLARDRALGRSPDMILCRTELHSQI